MIYLGLLWLAGGLLLHFLPSTAPGWSSWAIPVSLVLLPGMILFAGKRTVSSSPLPSADWLWWGLFLLVFSFALIVVGLAQYGGNKRGCFEAPVEAMGNGFFQIKIKKSWTRGRPLVLEEEEYDAFLRASDDKEVFLSRGRKYLSHGIEKPVAYFRLRLIDWEGGEKIGICRE